MTLSWKDLITTLLATLVVGFSYLMIQGAKIPLISGYRLATIVLLVLGIGMCALGSYTPGTTTGTMITILSVLGGASLILAVAALFTGTKLLFLLFAGTIVVMWLLSTIRHFMGG